MSATPMMLFAADSLSAFRALARCTSYAGALASAIRRRGALEIDGLAFEPINGDAEYDGVNTGRHTRLYRLAGTDKTYRLMVEPVAETHGGRP